MAIGDAYITTTLYRGIIGKTSNSEDAEEALDLKAVSRLLERKLGRFFNQDALAVARVYIPGRSAAMSPDRRTLYVDDIASTTGLAIKVDTDLDGSFADETAFGATDYELHDLNAALEPEAQPWTRIYIPSWSTKDLWKSGYPVQVTAKFGWPAVPDAIARATAHITAILRLESPRATQRIPEGLDEAADQNPKVKSIIDELALHYARPAGPRSAAVFV